MAGHLLELLAPGEGTAAMNERPILFSAPMVRAILAGAKTQTRRVIKNQPFNVTLVPSGNHLFDYRGDLNDYSRVVDMKKAVTLCPYGRPGDRLWVRETWAHGIHAMAAKRDEDGPFVYAATHREDQRLGDRWKPSIHMPRAASRILLEIISVRVERLQSITRGDAMDEGCPFPNMAKGDDPRQWFANLWRQLNGPDSWDANPWVWVIEFKAVKP